MKAKRRRLLFRSINYIWKQKYFLRLRRNKHVNKQKKISDFADINISKSTIISNFKRWSYQRLYVTSDNYIHQTISINSYSLSSIVYFSFFLNLSNSRREEKICFSCFDKMSKICFDKISKICSDCFHKMSKICFDFFILTRRRNIFSMREVFCWFISNFFNKFMQLCEANRLRHSSYSKS